MQATGNDNVQKTEQKNHPAAEKTFRKRCFSPLDRKFEDIEKVRCLCGLGETGVVSRC